MNDPALALKLENSALKKKVKALVTEIGKLQTKNAKLETYKVSASLRIKALEKLKVLPESEPVDPIEGARRIAFVLARGAAAINK